MSDGLEHTTKHDVLDIEGMMARYAPSVDTYEIRLPYGEVFTFRAIQSYSDLKQFEREAVRWYESLPRMGSNAAKTHAWSEFLPSDAAAGIAAYTISGLSVEPKIEQLDALKMMAAPWLVNYFMKMIDRANRSIGSIVEGKILDEAKNESGETVGGEPN